MMLTVNNMMATVMKMMNKKFKSQHLQ